MPLKVLRQKFDELGCPKKWCCSLKERYILHPPKTKKWIPKILLYLKGGAFYKNHVFGIYVKFGVVTGFKNIKCHFGYLFQTMEHLSELCFWNETWSCIKLSWVSSKLSLCNMFAASLGIFLQQKKNISWPFPSWEGFSFPPIFSPPTSAQLEHVPATSGKRHPSVPQKNSTGAKVAWDRNCGQPPFFSMFVPLKVNHHWKNRGSFLDDGKALLKKWCFLNQAD